MKDIYGMNADELRSEQARLVSEKAAIALELQNINDQIRNIHASKYTTDLLPLDMLNGHRVEKLIAANRLISIDTKLRYINNKLYSLKVDRPRALR
jgi:hypothetical protein